MLTAHLSLYVTTDETAMAERAAKIILEKSKTAIKDKGVFKLAISGGKTPRPLFHLLSTPVWADIMEWNKTDIYWADERCVGPEHEDSNYRVAREELLKQVDATRFYRMKGEEEPEAAAKAYEALLMEHFKLKPGELPRFDCVILGVGADGHTASLFPGDIALKEEKHLVTDVYVPRVKTPRITLTLPVLNNAACCIFLASGREKNHVLSTALNLMAAPLLPAQMVRPINGELCWIIDYTAYQG